MSLKHTNFRYRLILSLVLLLLPLIASDAYFHYQHYRDSRNAALAVQMKTALDLAQATDLFVSRTVAVQRSVGQALAKSYWRSAQARQDYIEAVLASNTPLSQIALADPDGNVVQGAPVSVVGYDVSGEDYFRRIRDGADWAVSNYMVDQTCDICGFVIATGVRDGLGNLIGVVISGVDEGKLRPILHIQTSPQTRLILLDTTGRPTFQSGKPSLPAKDRDWQAYDFVQSALRGEQQYVERLSQPDQPELTGAMVSVPSLGWAAGAFVPREQVVGPVRDMVLQDILVTSVLLGLTFLIGSVIAKQITAPVEHLSQAAQRLGQGELLTRASVSGITELETLAQTMNRMAESIQERDQALREAYERERRIAVLMQQRMLPAVPDRVGGMEIATGYFPALEEAELGGDLYDVMLLPSGLVGLVIADVSGKGLTAAVHTAMAKYMLEGFASDGQSPAEALRKLNRAMATFLRGEAAETFVTGFFAVADPSTGQIVYANAGHPSPLLRRKDGSTVWLDAVNGFPLGVDNDAGYSESQIALAEGDSLLLYTDGVIEAHRGGEWFEMEELASMVKGLDVAPAELVLSVYQAVSDFAGGSAQDDIALVAIRMTSLPGW
ncbi:MAG: SpoIIE family protein phosphatase [Armatimonadota bacterium]